MSKILIIGTGPLFSPEVKLFSGQSLRTWHFTRPLREVGHNVDLVVLPTEGFQQPDTTDNLIPARADSFNYSILRSNDPAIALPTLQSVLDRKSYDAIVAVNVNAAYLACQLDTRLPIWADLFGHVMGEAQTKCLVHNDDTYLRHFWARQRVILRRADRFSTVSHKQMYATLGELGVLGRLSKFTCSHSFLSVIPVAAHEVFLGTDVTFAEKRFRGQIFPEDAFVVLWSGGFNTWTDVRGLAAALSLAMEQIPRMHFVSTGGQIPGHDEISYPQFQEEMNRSGFSDRCHFLGWIEAAELPHLYGESDLGLNFDGLNYETLFGARNRLTNLMAAGVPVLTTLGTEVSEIIAENRLGYTVRVGKLQEYADMIFRAFRNPLERRQLASRARAYCRENFSYDATARNLLRWAAEPALAPDNREKISRLTSEKLINDITLNTLEAEALHLIRDGISELSAARTELESLRATRWYRMGRKLGLLR